MHIIAKAAHAVVTAPVLALAIVACGLVVVAAAVWGVWRRIELMAVYGDDERRRIRSEWD
jgi:hypothetical protein